MPNERAQQCKILRRLQKSGKVQAAGSLWGVGGVSETCRLLGLAVIYVPGIYELIGILRSRSIAAALFGRCTDKMPSRALARILS